MRRRFPHLSRVLLLSLLTCRGLSAAESPIPTPAAIRQHLARGDAVAATQTYNALCLRQSIHVQSTQALQALRAVLHAEGYADDQIASPLLEPRDVAYLQRTLFLQQVARAAIGKETNPAAQAERLFAFVTRELVPYVPPDSFAWPDDVLIRGYGSCDQMSWALCSLAEQLRIPTLIVFLRDPQTGISHHTLAALRVDNRWRLFDAFQGIDYKGPAGPVDLLAALWNPGLLQPALPRTGEVLFKPEHLLWSTFHVYTDPRGCLPRWSLVVQLAGLEEPQLWINPAARIQQLRQEMAASGGVAVAELDQAARRQSTPEAKAQGAQPVSALAVEPFHFAFRLYRAYSNPRWLDKLHRTRAYGPFRKARKLHLQGKHEQALAQLNPERFGSKKPWLSTRQPHSETGLAADCLRFRGLALQALGRYKEAEAAFRQLQAMPSPWSKASNWNQATCLLNLGRKTDAQKALKQVPEPRRAAAALRLSRLPPAE